MAMTPEQREQCHAVHDLVVQADRLVNQVQRIESFLTFAPPEDRDLRAIAEQIAERHADLQQQLERYAARWLPEVARP